MNQHSIQDEPLIKFIVPKFHKRLAWIIPFLIIAIGIGISVTAQNWGWLSRAGALVVVIAMYFEATGIIEKYNEFVIRHTRLPDDALDRVLTEVKRMPYMYGLSGNETEDQLNQIAAKAIKERSRKVIAAARITANKEIREIEF